jgi:uncharacterized protein
VEAGNPFGENNLADLYLRGEGIRQDDRAAFAWFQKAASQGHTGARIKLGFLYANGRGTAKNLVAAYAWISAATAAGDARGKDLLSSLEKLLTPQQLAYGREQAERLRGSEHEPSARDFAQ